MARMILSHSSIWFLGAIAAHSLCNILPLYFMEETDYSKWKTNVLWFLSFILFPLCLSSQAVFRFRAISACLWFESSGNAFSFSPWGNGREHLASHQCLMVTLGVSAAAPIQSISKKQNMLELVQPMASCPLPFTRCHTEETAERHSWVKMPQCACFRVGQTVKSHAQNCTLLSSSCQTKGTEPWVLAIEVLEHVCAMHVIAHQKWTVQKFRWDLWAHS